MAEATETYHKAINPREDSHAVAYLKSRGMLWASVQYFKLGVVDDPLPGHEKYRGRLAIPYITRSGVVSMRFRAIPPDDSPAKYLSLPGDPPRLFNPLDLDRREPFVCITEGEFDAITAHQAGLPAVGVPGVQAWGSFWPRMFDGYETVYILADNDDKGQGAAFAEKVASQVPNSRVVLMPEGHDVNSYVLAEGPDALIARLEDRQ